MNMTTTKTTSVTRGQPPPSDAVVANQRPTTATPLRIVIRIAVLAAAAAAAALVVTVLLLSILMPPLTIMNSSSAIPLRVSYHSYYALSSSSSSPATTKVVYAKTNGPVETVFDWETQHCTDGSQRPTTTAPSKKHLSPRRRRRRRPRRLSPPPLPSPPYRRDVPDIPALAWKDPLNNVTYLVSGDCRGTWANVAVDGKSLDHVELHDCQRMIFNYSGSPHGWQDRSARDYANYEWLYAPFVVVPPSSADKGSANTTVYMLVHNEYHGWDRSDQGLCNATRMIHGRCWYNSVTLSVSRDGGNHFEHRAVPPTHMVAAADHVYVANRTMYGVFSPSQLVMDPRDDYLYSYPVYVSYDGTKRGVASMRTRDVSDPSSWRFLVDDPTKDTSNDAYVGIWTDPYDTLTAPSSSSSSSSASSSMVQQKPAILKFGSSKTSFSQPVPRYIPKYNVFVMVGYTNFGAPYNDAPYNDNDDHHNQHFGISTSSTPWGPWSTIIPIQNVDINPKRDLPLMHYRGLYPSLLDHGSLSWIFDTIDNPTTTTAATTTNATATAATRMGPKLYLYWVQPRNKTTVRAPDMARDLVRQPIFLTLEEEWEEEEEELLFLHNTNVDRQGQGSLQTTQS